MPSVSSVFLEKLILLELRYMRGVSLKNLIRQYLLLFRKMYFYRFVRIYNLKLLSENSWSKIYILKLYIYKLILNFKYLHRIMLLLTLNFTNDDTLFIFVLI